MKARNKCMFCEHEFETEKELLLHEANHNGILLPILPEELNRLLQFIMCNHLNENLLPPLLLKRIRRYLRKEAVKDFTHD